MRVIATNRSTSAFLAERPGPVPAVAPWPETEARRGPVDMLLGLGVLLLFTLSGYALESFGIPYVTPGGTILQKLHPATYVFALALLLAVVAHPDPIGYLVSLVMRRLGAIALIVACAVIYVFVSRYRPTMSAAYLVDAMVSAALVTLVLADAPERTMVRLARLLHIIVASNAALAIVEVSTGWRLFPFGVEGDYMTWDYRATALFGHPLDGALATGIYAVILMTAKDVPGLPERLRLPVILLCMAALPAIGARTSFAIVYGVAAVMAGLGFLAFLRGGSVRPRTLLAVLAAVPAAIVGVAVVFQLGYLDGFLGRFQNDSGSADARFDLYNLFSHYGLTEMLTGYHPPVLQTRVRVEGLEAGVENAWVGHLLQFGIPLSVMLWCALAAFLAGLVRSTSRLALLPIFYMLAVNSTTVGISGKTTMLVMPVIILLILLSPARAKTG